MSAGKCVEENGSGRRPICGCRRGLHVFGEGPAEAAPPPMSDWPPERLWASTGGAGANGAAGLRAALTSAPCRARPGSHLDGADWLGGTPGMKAPGSVARHERNGGCAPEVPPPPLLLGALGDSKQGPGSGWGWGRRAAARGLALSQRPPATPARRAAPRGWGPHHSAQGPRVGG